MKWVKRHQISNPWERILLYTVQENLDKTTSKLINLQIGRQKYMAILGCFYWTVYKLCIVDLFSKSGIFNNTSQTVFSFLVSSSLVLLIDFPTETPITFKMEVLVQNRCSAKHYFFLNQFCKRSNITFQYKYLPVFYIYL